MPRASGAKSPINLQRFLKGAEYPSSRDELYELAENNGAEEDVLDIIGKLPDVDFESVADVQEAYGDVMDNDGDNGSSNIQSLVREVEQNRSDTRPSGRRRQDDEDEDEDEDRRSESRRGNHDDHHEQEMEMHRRHYEERKRLRAESQQKDDDEYDHRLRGHETRKMSDARHMVNGDDGRGRVTNPKTDKRLGQNETQALHDARRMLHVKEGETDGRGRVRKFGPGQVDERINREDTPRRRNTEPDPETGAMSHRRKDDDGQPRDEYQTAEERHKRMTYREHKRGGK